MMEERGSWVGVWGQPVRARWRKVRPGVMNALALQGELWRRWSLPCSLKSCEGPDWTSQTCQHGSLMTRQSSKVLWVIFMCLFWDLTPILRWPCSMGVGTPRTTQLLPHDWEKRLLHVKRWEKVRIFTTETDKINGSGGQYYNKYHVTNYKNISRMPSAFTNAWEAQGLNLTK